MALLGLLILLLLVLLTLLLLLLSLLRFCVVGGLLLLVGELFELVLKFFLLFPLLTDGAGEVAPLTVDQFEIADRVDVIGVELGGASIKAAAGSQKIQSFVSLARFEFVLGLLVERVCQVVAGAGGQGVVARQGVDTFEKLLGLGVVAERRLGARLIVQCDERVGIGGKGLFVLLQSALVVA